MPPNFSTLLPGIYMLPVTAEMFDRLGPQAKHTIRSDFRRFASGKEVPFLGETRLINAGSRTIEVTDLVVGESAFSIGYCMAWGRDEELLFVIAFALSIDKSFAYESVILN